MAHDNNKKASDHDLEFTEWLVDILDTCGMDGLIFEGYLGGALEELPKNASMQVIEEKISEVMESYYVSARFHAIEVYRLDAPVMSYYKTVN